MKLTPMLTSFVMHFGEMGSRWGFNRTVGQMYALLVVSPEPLTAMDMAETLNISRGNVSMGLKELQSWQLVQVQHQQGDRKDYFRAVGSIWDMAKKVMEERRKREIDPTLSLLRDMLLDAPANEHERHAQDKLQEIHDLLEAVTQWTNELQRLSPDNLNTLLKLSSGVGKVLDMKDKFLGKDKDSA
ncbi:GbsR/MarR family transcriptional regulator [Aliiglaciecola sp. CAU 1673]|uniref:GbsR/MarR family transcriptional regulator n=1 Tax=Aliiglaciecola sp. CAU 1673 TaxID=3032595 RepID=UPI0023DA6365|nr:GbsR/MarR family transcriptional regulator [Aliiglaciecola sp. CAU 1673]MDF2176727.1 GbsR/MarR family transcriptional regulator [Aliiglaciecola sp. CAU 1673]